MTQQPTTTSPLWSDDGGMIICAKHSSALSAAVSYRPRAKTHRTDIGTFTLITAADVADWDTDPTLPPLSCEQCGALPTLGK